MSEAKATNGSATNTLEAVVAAAHETAGAFSTLERQLRHSRSFYDVQAVDAGHALSPPPLKNLRKSQGSQSLLDTSLKAVQEDENEVAEVVVVCEPEGMLAVRPHRFQAILWPQLPTVPILPAGPLTKRRMVAVSRDTLQRISTVTDACAVFAACAVCHHPLPTRCHSHK
jgi:hypothetical protein